MLHCFSWPPVDCLFKIAAAARDIDISSDQLLYLCGVDSPVKACTQILVESLIVLVLGCQRSVHHKLPVLVAALAAHRAHINHHDLRSQARSNEGIIARSSCQRQGASADKLQVKATKIPPFDGHTRSMLIHVVTVTCMS